MSEHSTDIGRLLGKQVAAPEQYDASILVREPRQTNRTSLGIEEGKLLPFLGFDVWNAWECSVLGNNGCPFCFILKIVYPADSKYIVESKSLKLYLHSFNMTKFKLESYEPAGAVIYDVCELVQRDLAELLCCAVTVTPFSVSERRNDSEKFIDDGKWTNLASLTRAYDKDVVFSDYNENPALLSFKNHGGEQWMHSALLRSNCRVTKQPDNGDVYIYMKGPVAVDELSLLKYIVSFRNECHFHEEIVECIYQRLWDKFGPEKLLVFAQYVRRGGIDINPIRASHSSLIPSHMIGEYTEFYRTIRQ